MLRQNKRLKILTKSGISFKTATIIVIGLHLLGFFGLTQWSSYKTNIARQSRIAENERRIEDTKNKEVRWPTSEIKPRVLAVAPTPKPAQTTSTKESWWERLFKPKQIVIKTTPTSSKQVAGPNKPTQQEDIAKLAEAARQALRLLDEKSKQLEKVNSELAETKRQLKPTSKTTSTEIISSKEIKIKNGSVVSEEQVTKTTRPATRVVVTPNNTRTYSSNGFNYVNLDNLLSSHITLD